MTPLPLIAYRLVTRALEPLAPRLLDARARRGKGSGIGVQHLEIRGQKSEVGRSKTTISRIRLVRLIFFSRETRSQRPFLLSWVSCVLVWFESFGSVDFS